MSPARIYRPSHLGGAGAEGRTARPTEEGRLQVNPQHRAEWAFSLHPHSLRLACGGMSQGWEGDTLLHPEIRGMCCRGPPQPVP